MQRPSIIGLFCEDLREEKSGADIIVGVFPDNVNVAGQAPQLMPKLAVYGRVHVPVDYKITSDIVLLLFDQEGKQLVELANFSRAAIQTTQEEVRARGGAIAGFISRAVISPFQITQSGRVVMRARLEGDDFVCGSLNLILDTNEVAAQPS